MIVVEPNCDNLNPPGHCKNVWSRMNTVEIVEIPVPPKDEEDDGEGTLSLGCGETYEKGRCNGKDTVNCLYENANQIGAEKCAGVLKLVKVP